MRTTDKLKLKVFEAENAGLINAEDAASYREFLESADETDPADRSICADICNALMEAAAPDPTNDAPVDPTSVKLAIYESEANGEIDAEERDLLLSMMD